MADIPPPIHSINDAKSWTMDLKSALNARRSSATYTRITDLREESGYRIVRFERVTTPYGDTVIVTVEGLDGDDMYLRIYLPRRFNDALSDRMIEQYNGGLGDRLHLVRRHSAAGSKYTPLEFL